MGVRFGKSIRVGKHFRINVSKSGIGASVGVKGLRVGTGPRGSRITATVPGTGISHSTRIGGRKQPHRKPSASSTARPKPVTRIPSPGILAPKHKKEIVKGLNHYINNRIDKALPHFLSAADKDACAAMIAGIILAKQDGKEAQAISLLENIVKSDAEFPTPMMNQYITSAHIQMNITDNATVTVPMDGLAVVLVLAELYQDQNRIDEAIGLLEEVEAIASEPAMTLSLCELYAERDLWDGIIEQAKGIESEDDITLETMILYGRAMQKKGLHDAAISVFGKALRRKKSRSPVLLCEAKYWRAVSYLAVGKRSQANRSFQEVYAESPDFRDVRTYLSV